MLAQQQLLLLGGLLLCVVVLSQPNKHWVESRRGKCDKFVEVGSDNVAYRSQRLSHSEARFRRNDATESTTPSKWPNKTTCVGHSYVPASVSKRSPEDKVVPLCQGFDSPWNSYVTVTQPYPMSTLTSRQGDVHTALLLVDSGDSDLMIFPSWGHPPHYNQTEADLWSSEHNAYVVQPPFELLCKEPVADSWGKRSLLVRGPITLPGNVSFVTEFYQNLAGGEDGFSGSDHVGNFAPGNAYSENPTQIWLFGWEPLSFARLEGIRALIYECMPVHAAARGWGRGTSPIRTSGYKYVELDFRLGRPSIMTFTNRETIKAGYTMLPIANDSIMSFRAKSVVISDPRDPTGEKSYRKDFQSPGIISYLDTGGQTFSLRTDPSFIKATPWNPCGCSGDRPCNPNCDCGQGPDTVFFNTSWRLELAGDPQEGEQSNSTINVATRPLNGAWISDGAGSPNMDAGEHLTNIFHLEGINVGGPTFETNTILIETQRPFVGLKPAE